MNTKEMDLFERFNNNELTPDELLWFNNEINTNSEFASSYRAFVNIESIISDKKYRDLRLRFNSIHEKQSKNKITTKLYHFKNIASIAASFLLLISLSWYIWYNNTTNEEDKLFSTYYNDMYIKKGLNTTDSLYNLATNSYTKKQFQKSVELFKKLCSSDKSNSTYKFYLAMAYIGNKNSTEAERILLELINENNNLYVDNCTWYLALLYYHNKDYNKAKYYFNAISTDSNHYKHDDALKALKYID